MAVRAKRTLAEANFEPLFCSVDEAEVISGISRWTWRAFAYKGTVESSKIGRRLLIPIAEIKRMLQEGRRPRADGLEAGEPSKGRRHRDRSVTTDADGEQARV
jgi:hypothetical protein